MDLKATRSLLPIFYLFLFAPAHAQTSAVFTFNNRPPDQYPAAAPQDLSGTWIGEVTDGNTLWYYEIAIVRLNDNTYSGIDTFQLIRNVNGQPLKQIFHGTQTFTGTFNAQRIFVFSDVANLYAPSFPLLTEQLRFVMDGPDPVIINNNFARKPWRRIYMRRISPTPPNDLATYLLTNHSLTITDISYKNSKGAPVIAYNDHGMFNFSFQNSLIRNLPNIQVTAVADQRPNGIINYNDYKGSIALKKDGLTSFTIPINTNFSVPSEPLHVTVTLSYKGILLAEKHAAFSTDAFLRTSAVAAPAYSSPCMQAVAGYYGYGNTGWSDVAKKLDPLAATGDPMANMWKAVFLSMGYGGYKIDEEQGYMLGKGCIRQVEEKARQGDAEALYLLFYACQMGLEGDNARAHAGDFLEPSANVGFKPAIFDKAMGAISRKDYAAAFSGLTDAFNRGVKKAAGLIGAMYEKGLSVPPDNDSAIRWFKTGIAFGDPDAALWYADLLARGYDNTPPDINKALSLATAATAKNSTDAMIYIGSVYYDGRQGIAKNIATAIKWFREGAEQGDRQAMLALGEAYMAGGPSIGKDERSGLFWIKRAAELGSPKAMVVLSDLYNEGEVTGNNTILARYWYNQAVLHGYAQRDATGLNAQLGTFMDFMKYADFSPSAVYVNEYGTVVGDSGDGLLNGLFTGMMGAMINYYGNHQTLIDGLEFIQKRFGCRIYGGTVSSHFISNLFLKQGQTVSIRSYGIVSTGMMSGPATADGLGAAWPEYRIIKDIPCSAVMAAVQGGDWKFIGQNGAYTAMRDGPLLFALNAIDYSNYKGYFDIVVQVPDN